MSIPERLIRLVLSKTSGTASLGIVWRNAVSAALENGESESVVGDWVELFSSPRLFSHWVSAHVRNNQKLFETLARIKTESDESAYLPSDFALAIEKVLIFIDLKKRRSTPSTIVGYVCCAAEFAGNRSPLEPLYLVVDEMLKEYGFDG